MHGLRIIVHGSRRAASGGEVRQLAVRLRVPGGNVYDDGETACMKADH